MSKSKSRTLFPRLLFFHHIKHYVVLLLFSSLVTRVVCLLSSNKHHAIAKLNLMMLDSGKEKPRVVVTGAGSSVGLLVFKKLLRRKYPVVGLVRDKRGEESLKKLGATPDQIKIGDITKKETLAGVFTGANKAILCTSTRPQKKLSFRIKNFIKSIILRQPKEKPQATDLYFKKGESPYEVEYLGQKNVIDCCVEAKVEHIILCGNMGGYRGSKLNDIGREKGDEPPTVGNLLKWKRRAERYLMKRCLNTIIHSASLTDEKGGQREIVWDTDDALLRSNFKRIPRDDVAEVLFQSLLFPEAINRSIDIASGPADSTRVIKDKEGWLRFWSREGNCIYPFDEDM